MRSAVDENLRLARRLREMTSPTPASSEEITLAAADYDHVAWGIEDHLDDVLVSLRDSTVIPKFKYKVVDMFHSLGIPDFYTFYADLSSYVHGSPMSTSDYREDDEFVEGSGPLAPHGIIESGSWVTPFLSILWGLMAGGRLVANRAGQDPDLIITLEMVQELDDRIRALEND